LIDSMFRAGITTLYVATTAVVLSRGFMLAEDQKETTVAASA